jgi:hypothetical protein
LERICFRVEKKFVLKKAGLISFVVTWSNALPLNFEQIVQEMCIFRQKKKLIREKRENLEIMF